MSQQRRAAFERAWQPFFKVLRVEFGAGPEDEGDKAARRFCGWLWEASYTHPEPRFIQLLLGCYLDARTRKTDGKGEPIQDVPAFVMGWHKNRLANGQERSPARNCLLKASDLLRSAQRALNNNGVEQKAWFAAALEAEIKATAAKLKAPAQTGVGA